MIIVTGGFGFIGSNIVHDLNKRGITDIVIVDDLTNGASYKNLLGAKFTRYYDVDDFFNKFDSWSKSVKVFHQGAISNTLETNGKLVMQRNYQFTLDLFQKCINFEIPISYASSASVYGNKRDYTFDPLNIYAYSKMKVDEWALHNIKSFSLIHGWRYFNVYGNREDYKGDQASPITKFRKQIDETGIIKLFKESENAYRDFIAVDDIVKIVIDELLSNTLSSGVRDLGTGRVTSFETVANLIKRKYDGAINVVPFPLHLKESYQWYTQAQVLSHHSFMSIADWLSSH